MVPPQLVPAIVSHLGIHSRLAAPQPKEQKVPGWQLAAHADGTPGLDIVRMRGARVRLIARHEPSARTMAHGMFGPQYKRYRWRCLERTEAVRRGLIDKGLSALGLCESPG
jgi:hypothetical protein